MPSINRPTLRSVPSLSLALLIALLSILWVSGGASRADAMGQIVARSAAWALLIAAILFGDRPRFRDALPVALLLLGALLLALLQLTPLPPDMWLALPGRTILAGAADVSGQRQPWRPLSIVPGATVNASSSMIIPLTTLLLATGLAPAERRRTPGLLLCFVSASALIGLLQFSGNGFNNPLVNDAPGQVGGLFANRNHFALFTAMGCLLAPAWAFGGGRRPHWRGPVALALVLLFALIILASGSRAGMILGVVGIGAGLVLVQQGIRMELSRYPRWAFPALIASVVGVISTFVLFSVAADRAVSIDRAFAIDPGQDMRTRGLPTVLAMIREYFPFGSGVGGFDPVFRMHEPLNLLKLTYFNHAHNDFLEVVLDAGLLGLLLLAAALLWWAWASVRAWRASARDALPKLGSAMLLLVIVASAFDYPARTPIIMAMMVISGVWLSARVEEGGASSLPKSDQHL